jgi:uncharacterized protein (DUF2147 family)
MLRRYDTARLLVLATASVALLTAQTPPVTGHWEGSVQAPDGPVELKVDLNQSSTGAWSGTITVPSRNITDAPLLDLSVQGKTVSFAVVTGSQKPIFKAGTGAEGKEMAGDLLYGNDTVPFKLRWTGQAQASAKDLSGVWEGTAEIDGSGLRLVVSLHRSGEGSYAGTVDAGEEKDIRIASLRQDGTAVSAELPAMGVTYTGKVNPSFSEIAGEFTRDGTKQALLLKRAR